MIQIYNTLTRQKEAFKPIEEGKVSMYVCGPTVYNYIHIGNARSTVSFDTIRRYFEYRGYDVNFVSNFTDVDDKIIRVANETGMTAEEVSKKYIEAFFEDTNALNVKKATLNPTVMNTMDDIIAFVADLVDKGMAYESEGLMCISSLKNSKTMENSATNASKTYKSGQVIVQPQKMMQKNAIRQTLHYGKAQNQTKSAGTLRGAKVVQDGILNAQ